MPRASGSKVEGTKTDRELAPTPGAPARDGSAATRADLEKVRGQLERILASSVFRNAPRQSRFLRFVVETALEGEAENIKEYSIGVEVFEDPEFNPSTSTRVRVQAVNLRHKLTEYYLAYGQNDPVVIELPKGTYVPVFRFRDARSETEESSFTRMSQEAALDLSSKALTTGPSSTRGNRRPVRRLFAILASGITLIALALGAIKYRHASMTRHTTEAQQITKRPAVAVLPFKNLSARPESEWISTALSELLTTELAAGEKLRLVRGEDIATARTELSLGADGSYSKELLNRLRQSLGVDYVVVGSYFDSGGQPGQIRLDLRLQDAATAQVTTSVSETGTDSDLPDMVVRVGTQLRERLEAGEMAPTDVSAVRGALPLKPDAARFYAEGLQELRLFDALGGRHSFQKAVAVEPVFPLAHSALAEAWSVLGYEARARDEAEKALSLAAGLPREQYLVVEARYREIKREWNRAIQIYQALSLIYPDNLEYGLRLVAAQCSAGRGKDALGTVKSLRNLPPPASSDPRIDLAEAQAAESVADFRREQAAAAAAVEKARIIGARLLGARALLSEGWALDNLGRTKEALAVDQQAKELFAGVGDRVGVGRAVKNIADAIDDQGNYAGARKAYEEALAISEEIDYRTGMVVALNGVANTLESQGDLEGAKEKYAASLKIASHVGDRGREALGLNGMGLILWRQGDLIGARKMFEDARAIHHEAGDKSREAVVLNNIAAVLIDQGDLSEARKEFEGSLALSRELNDQIGIARALSNLGDVLSKQGDLAGATERFEEALEISNRIQRKRDAAYALYGLGQGLLARGDLAGARKRHEKALELRDQIGEAGTAAESRLALADLSIEEGRQAEAQALAHRAADEFRKEGETEFEAAAYAVFARSLLAAGKLNEAEGAITKADQLMSGTEDREARFLVGVDDARVRAAQGSTAQAMAELQPILAEAKKYGYVGYEFEAQLALGEIEMKSGGTPKAHPELVLLARHAQAKGFGLIARKAEDAVAANGRKYGRLRTRPPA